MSRSLNPLRIGAIIPTQNFGIAVLVAVFSFNPLRIGAHLPTLQPHRYLRENTRFNPLRIGALIATQRHRFLQMARKVSIPFASGRSLLRRAIGGYRHSWSLNPLRIGALIATRHAAFPAIVARTPSQSPSHRGAHCYMISRRRAGRMASRSQSPSHRGAHCYGRGRGRGRGRCRVSIPFASGRTYQRKHMDTHPTRTDSVSIPFASGRSLLPKGIGFYKWLAKSQSPSHRGAHCYAAQSVGIAIAGVSIPFASGRSLLRAMRHSLRSSRERRLNPLRIGALIAT